MSYPHQVGLRNRAGSPAVRRFSLGVLLSLTPVFAACDAGISAIAPEELPSSIQLSTTSLDLAGGDTARVVATLVGASGRPVASPSAGAPKPGTTPSRIRWTSSDTDVVDITRSGLVHAKGNGDVTITASSGNLRASSRVKVNGNKRSVIVSPKVDTLRAIDESLQLSATLYDNSGQVVTGANVSWTSLNSRVATVDATGTVRALAVGVALVTATTRGGVDTATIHVRQAVTSVEVSPGGATLTVGQTQPFTATAYDANGHVVPGIGISWSSSNTSVATVSSSGGVSAKAGGSATVRATAPGVAGSASVTVAAQKTVASPAPTGDLPNQPSGFSFIANRDFLALEEEGWAGSAGSSRFMIASDNTAPASAPTVGRMAFDSTHTPRNGPANTWRTFPEVREVYIAFWLRLSDNFRGGTNGVSKILFAMNRNTSCKESGMFYNALTGVGDKESYGLRAFSQGTDLQSGARWSANLAPAEIFRGRWYLIEHVLKGNTPGQMNGEIHTWLNGTKVMEHTGIGWVDYSDTCAQAGKWRGVKWNPTWGGSDDEGKMHLYGTFHMDIDRIYLSGRN